MKTLHFLGPIRNAAVSASLLVQLWKHDIKDKWISLRTILRHSFWFLRSFDDLEQGIEWDENEYLGELRDERELQKNHIAADFVFGLRRLHRSAGRFPRLGIARAVADVGVAGRRADDVKDGRLAAGQKVALALLVQRHDEPVDLAVPAANRRGLQQVPVAGRLHDGIDLERDVRGVRTLNFFFTCSSHFCCFFSVSVGHGAFIHGYDVFFCCCCFISTLSSLFDRFFSLFDQPVVVVYWFQKRQFRPFPCSLDTMNDSIPFFRCFGCSFNLVILQIYPIPKTCHCSSLFFSEIVLREKSHFFCSFEARENLIPTHSKTEMYR